MLLLLPLFSLFGIFSQVISDDSCGYSMFKNAMVQPRSQHRPFDILGISRTLHRAKQFCDRNITCQAIAKGFHHSNLYFTTSDEEGLQYTDDVNCTVWMKSCPGDPDYLLRTAPDIPGYFDPVLKGTQNSAMIRRNYRSFHDEASNDVTDDVISPARAVTSLGDYDVTLGRVSLPRGVVAEEAVESWCIYKQCEISPRTYFQPVTQNFSIIGLTDSRGQGHVMLFGESELVPKSHVVTKVNNKPAKVAGVHGFHDGRFAVLLFVPSANGSIPEMYLQFYRSDLSVEWTTLLNSAIAVPARDVGDFRLSYGSGYFAAYFSVLGTENFANGTNGEQLAIIDDRGKLKSTSFKIPGQTFVKSGDAWGCSHSLAQLVDFHSVENQFVTVCAADLFPRGISLGDSVAGTLLYKADGDGLGFASSILGQLAQAEFGWKMLFAAQNSECCPGRGIGFVTIYNEEDSITGKQAFDPVTWLTQSDGSTERDPVIGRIFTGDVIDTIEELFLVGWRDSTNEVYKIGIADSFGNFYRRPIDVSSFPVDSDNLTCTSDCVKWGNRDDSFTTLMDGRVGWISLEAGAKSINFYKVGESGDVKTGWSLWSGWSQCSRSCGTGVATRVRSCLAVGTCDVTEGSETQQCNTFDCTVPIKCTFVDHPGENLDGDLFVNRERQFAFTRQEGKEKCAMFKDLCAGITRRKSRGFYFYFLKTGTNRSEDAGSTSYTMTCKESPGWSDWSTWSACSASCGGGSKGRSRFCDGADPGSPVCQGGVQESQRCRTGQCPKWSTWTDWSQCSTTCDQGNQDRRRTCEGDYPDGCSALIGRSVEEQACSLGRCSSWGAWRGWSRCSDTCGGGIQERTRDCSGDFPCPILPGGPGDTDTRPCNPGECPYWSQWSQWGQCGATCGDSQRFRTRGCLGDFQGECPLSGPTTDSEGCNLGGCNYWDDWGAWEECSRSCGQGVTRRNRRCLGDFDAASCPPGGAQESKDCNYGSCAFWDDWVSWSACSASCGQGVTSRSRKCIGNFSCPNDQPSQITTPCNLGVCPSWSQWGSWGPCSITCGTDGLRTRRRDCLGDFPDLCDDTGFSEEGSCPEVTLCPRWTTWSQWGQCSRSCGKGMATRSRSCGADDVEVCDVGADDINPAPEREIEVTRNTLGLHQGHEKRGCTLGSCSYWLEWGAWSACSASCDEGVRRRQRECFGDFPDTCLQSGAAGESEKCTRGRCGAWTEWSHWGACSSTCGSGTWTRSRDCLGEFSETCVGDVIESADCDVSDCVEECTPNPCKNRGECRRNLYLTRLYNCQCRVGWMGKHCEYRGPDLICGSDSIIVAFDRRIVQDEGLIDTDSRLVGLASRDSVTCLAYTDHFNETDWFFLVVPSPVDTSCGSSMEVTPSEYRVRNQVTWQAVDSRIRSTVILIDFTCSYVRDVKASSALGADGPLSVESYKREIELVTESGIFDVDISLFRDPTYQRRVSPQDGSSLVSLNEGEVVFVSVDLKSRGLLTTGDALLVMDTCFVTSSLSAREPMTYLLQESCPVNPFVVVLSNGESRSGRFSVRIFGWTGKQMTAEDVFIHCTVSICDGDKDNCKPDCSSSKRNKRSLDRPSLSRAREALQQQKATRDLDVTQSGGAVNRNGRPYTKIERSVAPLTDGRAALNSSRDQKMNFDPDKMVSAGPLEIFLVASRRSERSTNVKLIASQDDVMQLPVKIVVIISCVLFIASLFMAYLLISKRRSRQD